MIRRLSYPDAEIFLLCFNICDPDSFNNIRDKWVPELREYRPKVPIILVGTQVDQRNNVDVKCRLNMKGKKPVTPDEGEHCAKKIGAKKVLLHCPKHSPGINVKIHMGFVPQNLN